MMTDDSGSQAAVVIERTLDAPAALVWQLWTEPEHFAEWYGPDGATISVAAMDVRVGGARLVCMTMAAPTGPMTMWFAGEYREVMPYTRLVYTEFMSDEHGDRLALSEASTPDQHSTTEVRVELNDLGGRTQMRMTHVGVAEGSPGAVGWQMALDKLAAVASRTSA
jgi:uncharacterized protein YndB with AHSA1/START domain